MSAIARLMKRMPWRRRSFGLNELDLKLAEYLDLDQGFFVEAGANDGVRQSNTLYFERYRGWRGLLVEPIPGLAEKCRRNRPTCIVENAALVPFDYPHDAVEMRFCDLMSVVKGGMKSQQDEEAHIEAGCQCQAIESHEFTAPAATLSGILDLHQIANVDLLSLDVEGFELSVLQGLDFERHAPAFMLIEARYRQEVDAFVRPRYEPLAEFLPYDVLYRLNAEGL